MPKDAKGYQRMPKDSKNFLKDPKNQKDYEFDQKILKDFLRFSKVKMGPFKYFVRCTQS